MHYPVILSQVAIGALDMPGHPITEHTLPLEEKEEIPELKKRFLFKASLAPSAGIHDRLFSIDQAVSAFGGKSSVPYRPRIRAVQDQFYDHIRILSRPFLPRGRTFRDSQGTQSRHHGYGG